VARNSVNAWLCGVVDGRRSGAKTVLGPSRSCPPPRNGWFAAPSLQCKRDVFVRVQAGTMLEEETWRKSVWLEIKRRIIRSAVGLKEMSKSAFWNILPHPKRKKTSSPA
jgi:hypothetical protein